MVRTGRDGRRVLIDDDVLDIARRLKEIDPRLGLEWNENGNFFAITEQTPDGVKLVTTATELDPRLIERVREIAHPSYDYAGELERKDRAGDRARDHAFHEQVGELGERAAFALRKDLQAQNKVFIP